MKSTTDFTSVYAPLIIFLWLCLPLPVTAQGPLVYMSNGSLAYTPFAMEGQTNAVNTIPDFSHAGYRGGGVALPTAPVKITLSPSGGDDTQLIQNAINAVEVMPLDGNGFRGAVLLTAGRYRVNQLFIEQSGVVLRGEGQGLDGTILFAQLQSQHTVITVRGTGSGYQRNTASKQEITTPYVPVGTYRFAVADASGYSVGDRIIITRTPNQFWIDDLGMDEATLCADDPGDCGGWTPSSYTINHERVVRGISGNTITVDLPIVDVMESQYGGGEIYQVSVSGRIEQCGVEQLRIESYYDPNDPEDEDHAWVGVQLRRTLNSWVTNVTGQHLGYGTVSISNESNFNTVQECATVDPISRIAGGRRYSFNISDGLGNLFQRNYTRGGRHDFVMGSRVAGPNVFLDNYSANTFSDIGPHHRWSTGTLFDNVRGGQIRVRNRGSSGSGHGWAGNTTMFWHLLSYDEDIWVDSPRGGRNWGIGCQGLQQIGAGHWESWNAAVVPRSLYLQQLEDRLGSQAVNNVTIPEQRNGNIYALLEAWAGECEFGEPSSNQELIASEDAYVRGGIYVDNNYGSDDQLRVKENGGSANNDRRSFIKFDLRGVSGPIYNVRLRLLLTNAPPREARNSVHFVNDDNWTEDNITWNNQPGIATLIGTQNVPAATGQWMEYDLTTYANQEIAGDGILSLRFSEATVDNLYAFASIDENGTSEDPHLRYQLTPQASSMPSCMAFLPVSWSYFTTQREDNGARLKWGTSSEANHDYFIVEWGRDGRRFSSLATVRDAVTTAPTGGAYTFLHPQPATGQNYYRIRQVDYDGSFSFSQIESLFFDSSERGCTFSVHPNPANEVIQLSFSTEALVREVALFDVTGKLIRTYPTPDTGQFMDLDITNLVPGIYLIRVGGDTQRVVIQ
ncbi:MAG: DNRLRE domain-containing protein [Bacteroidota bacterium]